jgi:hypothetical protein
MRPRRLSIWSGRPLPLPARSTVVRRRLFARAHRMKQRITRLRKTHTSWLFSLLPSMIMDRKAAKTICEPITHRAARITPNSKAKIRALHSVGRRIPLICVNEPRRGQRSARERSGNRLYVCPLVAKRQASVAVCRGPTRFRKDRPGFDISG